MLLVSHVVVIPVRSPTLTPPQCRTGHCRSQGEGIPSPCSPRARARASCVPGEPSPIPLSPPPSLSSLILSSFLFQGFQSSCSSTPWSDPTRGNGLASTSRNRLVSPETYRASSTNIIYLSYSEHVSIPKSCLQFEVRT